MLYQHFRHFCKCHSIFFLGIFLIVVGYIKSTCSIHSSQYICVTTQQFGQMNVVCVHVCIFNISFRVGTSRIQTESAATISLSWSVITSRVPSGTQKKSLSSFRVILIRYGLLCVLPVDVLGIIATNRQSLPPHSIEGNNSMVNIPIFTRCSTQEHGSWRNVPATTLVLSSILLLLSAINVMQMTSVANVFVGSLNNSTSSSHVCLKASSINKKFIDVPLNETDDAKKIRTIPEFEEEFPYRLTCPASQFNTTEHFQIIVGYHVGLVKNWKMIVHDQLRTLSACGWSDLPVTKFVLSYSNGPVADVLDIFKQYYPDLPQPTVSIESTKAPWEAAVMNELLQQCQNVDQKTVVFYFHNKGASKYEPDWRLTLDREWTYSK